METFLLGCLSHLLDPNLPCPPLPVELDNDRLYRLIVRHRLSGLFYLLGKGQTSPWPPSLQQQLQRDYFGARMWGERCEPEVGQVLSDLRDAGIPVLVLKGWAAIPTVYGNDMGLRTYADIDLLVPTPLACRAEGVLSNAGYSALPQPWSGSARRYEHGRSFQRTRDPGPFGTVFAVGLHWQLLILPFFFHRVPVLYLFDRAVPLEVAGERVLGLAAEDQLVYACGHVALHHSYDRSLFRAYEMAWIIRQAGSALDWDGVIERTSVWGLVLPVQRVLAWLNDLWPWLVPAGVLDAIGRLEPEPAERRVHEWMLRGKQNPAVRMAISWITLPGIGRKLGYLIETAFPSPSYMKGRYCPRYPKLWPLTYPGRAFLALQYFLQVARARL